MWGGRGVIILQGSWGRLLPTVKLELKPEGSKGHGIQLWEEHFRPREGQEQRP